ncbi:MAG: hypothetical protein CL907_03220 [Dehalococcoidia bacterium]|nr:hypothetical protein [Dehalococcoidia bacterium]MEC7921356.1 DUF1232 domain-containing protein [Chloroflexota bacterium]MEC9451730.1 DUF1232 domain-containing protein [Chloroflexota bacterium]MQG04749.1 DUF1232 domain-containing protein [SAR202 cluster bacterium]|tara:strand:+ start:1034 stop:1336 length:303 start_codon:yes stop_codon:yes gene_type:complete
MFKLIRFINVIKTARNSFRYLFNKEIPTRYKLIPMAGVIYFIMPLDLLPEIRIFGIGLIDDLFIIYIAFYWFERLSKKYLDSKEYIETDYEVRDKKGEDE